MEGKRKGLKEQENATQEVEKEMPLFLADAQQQDVLDPISAWGPI